MDNLPEDDSATIHILNIVTPIFAVALLCFLARVYTRVCLSYQRTFSDYTSVIGVAAAIATYALFVASVHAGYGRHAQYLTRENVIVILRLLLFVSFVGMSSATFTRLSIVLQLLQFSTSVAWKAAIWFVVAFQVIFLIVYILYTLLETQLLPQNSGKSYEGPVVVTFLFLGASILGDLLCSIMPLFIIWSLSRPTVERCLLSILMLLGLCATLAATMVAIRLKELDKTSSELLRDTVPVYTWCLVEGNVLIIASCTPLLKAPVERVLCSLGLPTFHNISRDLEIISPEHQMVQTR